MGSDNPVTDVAALLVGRHPIAAGRAARPAERVRDAWSGARPEHVAAAQVTLHRDLLWRLFYDSPQQQASRR